MQTTDLFPKQAATEARADGEVDAIDWILRVERDGRCDGLIVSHLAAKGRGVQNFFEPTSQPA